MILNKMCDSQDAIVYDVSHLARLYTKICKYYKYDITPLLAYGIGQGLSFEYVRGLEYRISPDFCLKWMHIGGSFSKDRRRLARILRIWLDVYRGDTSQKAYESYMGMLSQGHPLIVEVNLAVYYDFLKQNYRKLLDGIKHPEAIYQVPPDYYMNGYSVLLIGIEEETKQIRCLDVNLQEQILIPYVQFMEMHGAKTEYINIEHEYTDILMPKHRKLNRLEYAVLEAVKEDMMRMQSAPVFDEQYLLGMQGLKKLYEDACNDEGFFREDCVQENWNRVYHMSEVMYGKTGLGRKQYADFLTCASVFYPVLESASSQYAELAKKWSALLELCVKKEHIYQAKDQYVRMLDEIVKLEEQTCQKTQALCNQCYLELSKQD